MVDADRKEGDEENTRLQPKLQSKQNIPKDNVNWGYGKNQMVSLFYGCTGQFTSFEILHWQKIRNKQARFNIADLAIDLLFVIFR